ncbi:hypothetical protein NH340_JMT04135 [Sarcoptes scabiei]|nr:hypothetical protein NH340_JMT04135 [Sarcoptes scabiei]
MSLISETLDSSNVQYQCWCGQFKTIHHIYFCRHCHEIRCRDCLSHEVDSQFCSQCLEYIPSLDAKLKKNKCAQCYQCPCCHNTLATRIQLSSVPNQNDQQPPIIRKFSYYYCYFCRWTSRDIGLPDQNISVGSLPELGVPESKRLDSLFDYYRVLSQKEKNEKEKKRVNPRNAIFLLDKYGITSALSAKVTATLRARMARSSPGVFPSDVKSFPELEDFKPSVAYGSDELEKIEDLKIEDYYNGQDELKETCLDTVCDRNSLHQTLNQIERQCNNVKDLYPTSQMLIVKRSLRCKKCEHNLSKPEYSPSLIKFKIQLSAYYYVPEIRLMKSSTMKSNESNLIEMTITNPTQYLMNVTLLPVDISANPDCNLILPNTVLQLTPKDDTGDIIDIDSASKFNDDPNVISFRKNNKLGIYIYITPKKSMEKCQVEFRLRHDYVCNNITTTLSPQSELGDKNEPIKEVKWITHTVKVLLGNVLE